MTEELTLTEVAEVLGVSENTAFKQWAKCKDKALSFGIVKEGRGSKAKYIQTLSEDNNKIAYDILREFLINECKFNSRTDFDKLIHYLYLVLLNTVEPNESNPHYTYEQFANIIGTSSKNISNYRNKLTEHGIMKNKRISKGRYAYLDTNHIYHKCTEEMYDSFYNAVETETDRLYEHYKKNKLTFNLNNHNEYSKARNIMLDTFDMEELESELKSIDDINIRKELTVDRIVSVSLKNVLEFNRNDFYKPAFYNVSLAWRNHEGIVLFKFFPNHLLHDFIIKDVVFLEIIAKAYMHIINTR